MSGVSKEQIEKAKEWDLLTYLQAYEPQELKRCGPNEYCTVTHDSLKISHGMWCWNSQGVGGKTAQKNGVRLKVGHLFQQHPGRTRPGDGKAHFPHFGPGRNPGPLYRLPGSVEFSLSEGFKPGHQQAHGTLVSPFLFCLPVL